MTSLDLRSTLAANPTVPDAQIARLCGVSRARVGQVRKAMGLQPAPRDDSRGRAKRRQINVPVSAPEAEHLARHVGDSRHVSSWLRELALRESGYSKS